MATRITVHTDAVKGKISKHIYGHFAEHLGRCIYEGVWVGENSPIPNTDGIRNDVLEALKQLQIPVLRWPGGCFADDYHWKDGVGPRAQRKPMANTNWGGGVENNHFGTHEFLQLCELLGAEPYISGNVGSGTVREMSEWVEYITYDGESPMAQWRKENGRAEPWRLKYFGVGNENWGCGGHMRPEYYADLYRHYQTYVRNYGDNRIYKIACGPNDENYHWMEVLMKQAGGLMDGISVHYYTVPGTWADKGTATGFSEEEWFTTIKKARHMDTLLTKHSAIMDRYDPNKRIGLIVDEWGTWYNVEEGTNPAYLYQQNTVRDALVAGETLHIFHNHCDRVHMANIAQLVNVLQAVILTDGERMLRTPTYHVFDMYKVHQDASLLRSECITEDYSCGAEKMAKVSMTASRNAEGEVHISLTNPDPHHAAEVEIELKGLGSAQGTSSSFSGNEVSDQASERTQISDISGTELTASRMDAHNTFNEPNQVVPTAFTNFRIHDGTVYARLSPMSVTTLKVK